MRLPSLSIPLPPLAGLLFLAGLTNSAANPRSLPEGFHVQTFARPPEITYPTAVAASPEGQVFVSVDLNSSLDRKPDRGKIVRCVDTNQDGVADHFTDYVPRIESPRGSCFAGGTLYVVHPPFLSAFRDTDQDGVSDEQDVLVRGLGFDLSFRGADHTSNGVRMGIDGWLYLAIGDYGFTNAVAKDGSSLYLHGGGVVRVRPDGSELEPYSLYTRNIYDVAISPTLDMFARDNTNDGKGWNTRLHHFISLANHGYPRLYQDFPDEILAPLADYGGGSGTGGYYLDEPGFPPLYNDKLYTCDFTTRHIYAHDLEQAEATFRASQRPFYAIQAIDLDVDGFSRLYVCDWEGGGYTYKEPAVGSISLITYPGLKPAPYPDVKNAAPAQLLEYLSSNSAVLRLNAQREILDRPSDDALINGLQRLASDRSMGLYARVAALFTLKQWLGAGSHDFLLGLARDESVREFALRALADRLSQASQVPAEPFVEALQDANPRVRLQGIIGLARLGQRGHAGKILPLAIPSSAASATPAPSGHPRAIPHIAVKAVVHLQAAEACLAALSEPSLREAAWRCLREIHTAEAVDGLIARLAVAEEASLAEGLLLTLFRLYHVDKKWDAAAWWTTRPDDRGPYFEPVTWEQSAKIQQAIELHFGKIPKDRQPELLLAMRRNRLDPGRFKIDAAIDEVMALIEMDQPSPLGLEPLQAAAQSPQRPWPQRVAAFQAIARIGGTQALRAQLEVLEDWRRSGETPEHERLVHDFVYAPEHAAGAESLREALRGARDYPLQLLLMILLNAAQSPLSDAAFKEAAQRSLERFRARPEFIRAAGAMRLPEYRPEIEQAAQSDDHELATAGRQALERLGSAKAPSQESIHKTPISELPMERVRQDLMVEPGDPQLGAVLFARQGCAACHTVAPEQPLKGPYLGDAGSKWKRADLIQSILEPGAVVAQGFQSQWFELTNEFTYEGFVTAEKDGHIELRNVAGLSTRIAMKEIARRGTRETSMMPEGLADNLTLQELAALIAYLESLK